MHILFKIIYRVSQNKRHDLNGYNFLNIYGRLMKQKLAESRDFEIILHVSIYFSNNLPLAAIVDDICTGTSHF